MHDVAGIINPKTDCYELDPFQFSSASVTLNAENRDDLLM